MSWPEHALFDVSAHGLGHLAQVAPVIAALHRRLPRTKVTVRSGLPREVLARRIAVQFEYMPSPNDFGLIMNNPFTVDVARTEERYRKLHENLDSVLDDLALRFDRAGIDLVISNVGYLSLGAAQRGGTINFAFSSISWYDVLNHYCAGKPGIGRVLADMLSIYQQSNAVLRLVPGLEMPAFETIPIDRLIVGRGQDRRDNLLRAIGRGHDTLLVTFSFSEHDRTLSPSVDANAAGLVLVGPSDWAKQGRPWVSFEATEMSFLDLVWSSDLVVAKPGYGILTEAAIADTPALMVPRNSWPESATNAAWKQRHGRFEHTGCALHEVTVRQMRDAAERLSRKLGVRIPEGGGEEAVLDAVLGTEKQARSD